MDRPLDIDADAKPAPIGWWMPAWDRFCARIVKIDTGYTGGEDTRCWLWKNDWARADTFVVDGVTWIPYRWAYTHLVGLIPDGLTLDHLCRQPACCNPEHLEPVTLGVNMGRENKARAAERTMCVKGKHPWPEHKVTFGSKGRSYCRGCRADRRASHKGAAPRVDPTGPVGDSHDGAAQRPEQLG